MHSRYALAGVFLLRLLRGAVAVFVGLMVTSLIAEPIEFLLVGAVRGAFTTDQTEYFATRNRSPILCAKFLYNSLAAFFGGFAAAWLAGHRPVLHGHLLATTQAILFVWGMTLSEFAGTTPFWFWGPAVPIMYVATILGARYVAFRNRRDVGDGLSRIQGP